MLCEREGEGGAASKSDPFTPAQLLPHLGREETSGSFKLDENEPRCIISCTQENDASDTEFLFVMVTDFYRN